MSINETQHPVFEAVERGDLARVQRSIAEGADVDVRGRWNSTPLIMAAWDGHLDIVTYLTQQGADLDAQYDAGNSALIVAAWHGHLEVAQYLVGQGADIHVKNKGGHTALTWAAEHGHLEIVKLLVEHGADVNGAEALTAVCEWGQAVEVVKYLIGKGAELEARADRDGFTPLVAAAYRGNTDVVQALLAAGADPHVDHGAPLEWAALFDQVGAVECLLAAGAQADEKLGHDNTALVSAASHRPDERAKVVSALLEAGADVNGRGAEGVTPLHAAAQSGRLDIVELLLDRGADVAIEDDKTNTPVLTAAEAGHLKVVCLLVQRGADLDHRNRDGKSARSILAGMMESIQARSR